jgi:predicted acyl esterase
MKITKFACFAVLVNLYDFDRFTFFSRLIRKGSILRLVVGSLNSLDFQRNYNSGGIEAEETRKDSRASEIKLYHERQYPSSLEIPIAKVERR